MPVLPFRPPERRRLHQEVAEQLRDAILDGRYRVGDKLPPERELAEEFQVNRTSVREAIQVLEGLGLVRVRQGDGATVQPLVDASFDVLPAMILHGEKLDAGLLAELGEVMLPLLLEMGRLAIARHQPEQVEALRGLRAVVADRSIPRERRGAALRDVVVLLSDMTGNRVWQMLARRTRTFLGAEPLRETRSRLSSDPGRLVPAIDECLDALAAGRREDAVLALHQVIHRVGEGMLPAKSERAISASAPRASADGRVAPRRLRGNRSQGRAETASTTTSPRVQPEESR
jgi:GntR family transcriptional regulator, transcriptional repressor for pyruvate dehydrogenase complex